jgi:hypothetical protein
MKHGKVTFLLAGAALLTSGCISHHAFIERGFPPATLKDITAPQVPISVRLECSFNRNSKALPQLATRVEKKAGAVFAACRVFRIDPAANNLLSITVTESMDTGELVAKSATTGITMGLVGSHMVARYTMRFDFHSTDLPAFSAAHDLGLHATLGAETAPTGAEEVPYDEAFERAMEALMLRHLVDFEKQLNVPSSSAGKKTHAAP